MLKSGDFGKRWKIEVSRKLFCTCVGIAATIQTHIKIMTFVVEIVLVIQTRKEKAVGLFTIINALVIIIANLIDEFMALRKGSVVYRIDKSRRITSPKHQGVFVVDVVVGIAKNAAANETLVNHRRIT